MEFFPPLLIEVLFASEEQAQQMQITGQPISVNEMQRKVVDFYSIDAIHESREEGMTDIWNSAGRWLIPIPKDKLDMEIANQLQLSSN